MGACIHDTFYCIGIVLTDPNEGYHPVAFNYLD